MTTSIAVLVRETGRGGTISHAGQGRGNTADAALGDDGGAFDRELADISLFEHRDVHGAVAADEGAKRPIEVPSFASKLTGRDQPSANLPGLETSSSPPKVDIEQATGVELQNPVKTAALENILAGPQEALPTAPLVAEIGVSVKPEAQPQQPYEAVGEVDYVTLKSEIETETETLTAPDKLGISPTPAVIAVAVPQTIKTLAQVLQPVAELQRALIHRKPDNNAATSAHPTDQRGKTVLMPDQSLGAEIVIPAETPAKSRNELSNQNATTVEMTILRNETHLAPATTAVQAFPSPGLQVSARVAEALAGWGSSASNLDPANASMTGASAGTTKVLTIALAPADLGMVTVHMTLRGGELEVRVEAQEAAAARALSDDKSALLGSLKAAGYDIGSVAVTVSDQAVRFTPNAQSTGDGQSGNGGQSSSQSGSGSGSGAPGNSGQGANAGGSDGQSANRQRQPAQSALQEGGSRASAPGNRSSGVYL